MLTIEIEYCLPYALMTFREWLYSVGYRTLSGPLSLWSHHAVHFRVAGFAMRFTLQWRRKREED